MSQSDQIGELWSHIRDTQFGASEKEAHELLHIGKIEFVPPTPAHRKNLARPRVTVVSVKPRPNTCGPAHVATNNNRCLALNIVKILRPNYVQAKLHGTRTLEANPPRPELHVPHCPPEPAPRELRDHLRLEQEKSKRFAAAMRRETMIERTAAARVLRKSDPYTQEQILAFFDSNDQFEEQVNAR